VVGPAAAVRAVLAPESGAPTIPVWVASVASSASAMTATGENRSSMARALRGWPLVWQQ
jgi:hypothetical protein